MLSDITVVADTPEEKDRAEALAQLLGIPLEQAQASIRLLVRGEGLALQTGKHKPLAPDFSWATLNKKRQEGRQQGIVRACHPAKGVTIVDATAGWGRDAAILASFGAKVILLERHPLMQLLLEDALSRRDKLSRTRLDMQLIKMDALQWLMNLSSEESPDVIFMDPMHPLREKKALVKKDLQLLQQMIGPDEDALKLLEVARMRAKKRVVVKWPKRQPPLVKPSYSVIGSTIRFDCFVN